MKSVGIRQGKAKRVLGYQSQRKDALKEILAIIPTVEEILDRNSCSHSWEVIGIQADSGGETLGCNKCGSIHQCWFE
jgi:hypothetical protein